MKRTIFVLSLLGLMFSGYLSSVKFFTKTCALGETCPLFLGHPACYYGFTLFLILFVFSILLVSGRDPKRVALHSLIIVSFTGVLFAGYFTLGEIPVLFAQGLSAYVFGLPTCALGFIFFAAIFALALVERFRKQARVADVDAVV